MPLLLINGPDSLVNRVDMRRLQAELFTLGCNIPMQRLYRGPLFYHVGFFSPLGNDVF
ncbi:hypothetical protein D3C77_784920 [compost metagenome]